MNKQVHNRWVAASKMNEPSSGEALSSSGALFKPGDPVRYSGQFLQYSGQLETLKE